MQIASGGHATFHEYTGGTILERLYYSERQYEIPKGTSSIAKKIPPLGDSSSSDFESRAKAWGVFT